MMAEKDFEIGDLVWAKMRSFPFWPAKIVSPPTEEQKVTNTLKGAKKKSSTARKAQHYVLFFGSENYAWILDENIVPHSKEMLSKISKKQSASYVKAIEQIIEENKSIRQKVRPVVYRELTKTSTAIKVEKLTKKSRVPKQKIKHEKNKKSPQKRNLSQNESDKELSPAPKSSKKFDYSSPMISNAHSTAYNRAAVIGPLDDRSIVTQEYFSLPPEPPVDMSQTNATLKNKEIKPTFKKIGFIGLGMMGQRIVKNLIHSGHDVSIWNRSLDKCKSFVDAGAQLYLTPADLVSNCDIIFSCVSGPEAVKSIVFETSGVLQGFDNCLPGEKGYVELTSIDPNTSREIAEAISLKGARYLEAPVFGTRKSAEESSLVILAAGDPGLFQSCRTCLLALSDRAYFLSCEIGNGSKTNLALSMLMGTAYAALGEAMTLVERSGLSQTNFLEILDLGPMSCPLILEKGRAIAGNNFSTNTSLKYQQKDLNLGLTFADTCDQPMLLTSAANEIYKNAKHHFAEHDVSAVYLGAKY